MKICIVYLASPISFKEPTQSNLTRFDILKISLLALKTNLPPLPVIIFHENYTQREFSELRKIINNIQFEIVDFSGYEEHFVYRKRQKNYLMMCRFFCGPLQNHPALAQYDYYIRLDDDSFFISPKLNNIKVFHQNDYTYRSVFIENHDQSSLFCFTKSFLEKRKLFIDWEQLEKIGFLNYRTYTGLAPYNNFHCSKISMWRNSLVQEYLDVMEKQHEILKRMWLDANIHAMLIFMLAPVCGLKVDCLTTFGYRHNRHYSILNSRAIQYREDSSFCPSILEYKQNEN